MKERGETSGTSKPPVYVEVVRIYQTEYTATSPTPGSQQAQPQTQAQQQQEQAQTQQTGTPSPIDILEKRSSLLQSTLESWYIKQDYIITLSGLIPKMRAFGVEPMYSNVVLPDSRRAIDAYATLERYKKTLIAIIAETMLIATLVLDRLTRQYNELQKTYPYGALRGYDIQAQEISKDISDLTTLYNEIDNVKMPPVGDENALEGLVRRFSSWADTVYKYYSKYKDKKISTDTLSKMLKEQVDERKDSNLEKFSQSLTLLQDKEKLKDMLARFFVLMDYTRSETYNMYMNTYSYSIESLIKVINNQATLADFWNALTFVHVLLEMEAKGWLDYKKQLGEFPERRWEYHADPSQVLKRLDQKYREKLSMIEKGQVPERAPEPTVAFAEFIGSIDPFKYIYNYVYNSLAGVFGSTGAGAAASAVSGAVAGAASAVATPIAVVLGVIALTNTVVDIGTRLGNPVDREIFIKYVNEHWPELLMDVAIAMASAGATGYVVSKIKPVVVEKIAGIIKKISPSFAEKIMLPVKVVKGEPVYQSDTTIVAVDLENKKLYIYNKATGEIKNTATLKIPKNLEQYFDDPELKLSVSTIVGNLSEEQAASFLSLLDKIAERLGASGLRETVKLYLNKLNTGQLKGGVGIYFKGETGIAVDADGVSIFDPNTGKLVAITKASPHGEKFYPLLEISRQDPVAFNIYYLAKVYNIKPETLLEKLSPYLNAIKEGGKPVGEVTIGDLRFMFQGDKLNILLPDIGKPIQLDLKGFSPNSLLGLVLTGKEFANT